MANPSLTPNRLSLPDAFPVPAAWRGAAAAAAFSDCGRYRWWLTRRWQPRGGALVFVGLNPSTADGGRDDPTLRRLRGLAERWGYGQLLVLNLFARVGRDPAGLRRCAEPVGPHNDAWLATALGWLGQRASAGAAADLPARVWVGWGRGGNLHGRDRAVLPQLRCWEGEVVCVGLTRSGQPRHPLYCRASQPPIPFPLAAPPCPAFPVAMPSTCS
jgi:hypothetical protein